VPLKDALSLLSRKPGIFTVFLVSDGLTPSTFLPLTLYNTSTSQLCNFSPEDGDSMFLWNIGIYLQNYMAPIPKLTSTSSALLWEPQIFHSLAHMPSPYWLTFHCSFLRKHLVNTECKMYIIKIYFP
jgi:hypothetical protein